MPVCSSRHRYAAISANAPSRSIRFRTAWVRQGHSLEELPFKAFGGVVGSWFGVSLVTLVLIAQFYVAIWPIGGRDPDPSLAAQGFFKAYLAAPILLGFWVGAYIWKRTLPHKAMDIDLDVRSSFS